MGTKTKLPPGSRKPAILQTIGFWKHPTDVLERNRERYGPRFTIRLLGQLPFVYLTDPQEIKEMILAPPDVLHPGEGARSLEPLMGSNSVILLDEDPHSEQRKLMLPAFHGENLKQLSDLIAQIVDREVSSWPRGEAIEMHPRTTRLTMEVMLQIVFGLQQGERLERLRTLLTEILGFGESLLFLLPPKLRPIAARKTLARFERVKGEADRLVFELIDERRAAGGQGGDVLSMLLAARHEDGSPMSAQEVRDELITVVISGLETTASQLAWAFEQLARQPAVKARLVGEIDAETNDEYLTATIQEIMRCKPVLPNMEPRRVVKPIEIGGITYSPGVVLFGSIYLVHHDPKIYPQPYAFRPERFLEQPPGKYTWISFGVGRRRCIGASMAVMEMEMVLRTTLSRYEIHPDAPQAERVLRRGISITPDRHARVILRDRPSTGTTDAPGLGAETLAA
jgi:cytochrome P450